MTNTLHPKSPFLPGLFRSTLLRLFSLSSAISASKFAVSIALLLVTAISSFAQTSP